MKEKRSHYTQGAKGSALTPSRVWYQFPSSPTHTGICAPGSVPYSLRTTPPPHFPDVSGARLAFLLECFLLTHLSLPKDRKGREA